MRFRHAIVRPPAPNFAKGLTTANLGAPDYDRTLQQHRAYTKALSQCGLTIIRLDPDPEFPDSTFVEDTAVVHADTTIIMRPGALSRRGEIVNMISVVGDFFKKINFIRPPGRIDGGDVCITEKKVFIGISQRTNESGAQQLAGYLNGTFEPVFIDIRNMKDALHLKSGLSYLGENRMLVVEGLAEAKELNGFELVRLPPGEEYAANCIRVNDHVLVPSGFPKTLETITAHGYPTIQINTSEFRKMDGGLSCLSIRF
jgi:dimethylargininase